MTFSSVRIRSYLRPRAVLDEGERLLDLCRQRVGIQLGIGKVAVHFDVLRLLRLHDEFTLDLRFGPRDVRADGTDDPVVFLNDEDLRGV